MEPKPIKDPNRLGPHVREILDDLRRGGAEDIRVYKNKHLTICFRLGSEEFKVHTVCTPRDRDVFATVERGKLRRLFEARLAERAR